MVGAERLHQPGLRDDGAAGGTLPIVMRAHEGVENPMTGIVREIVEPERLVFTNVAADHEGKPLIERLTTVTFAEHGGKTKLTLETRVVGVVDLAARMLDGMEQAWTQSLECLEGLLASGKRSI
jgi:uncharacterized protein YndB with AHSA1/START domain